MKSVIFDALLLVLLAAASPQNKAPDFVNVTENTFESPYFHFHYSFPQGWLPQDDQARMENNRSRHDQAEKQDHVNVLWTYDLLLAMPKPASTDHKVVLPYVHILAIERSPFSDPGTYAQVMARSKSFKFLHKQQEKTFSGHKFMRSDLVQSDNHYEALFDTSARGYLLIFQFHGRTQEEMNSLAQTMESVKFDK